MPDLRFIQSVAEFPALIAGLVLPVAEQPLLHIVALIALRIQPHEQLIVLTPPGFLRYIIAAAHEIDFSAYHNGRMDEWGKGEKILPAGRLRHGSYAPYAVFIDQIGVTSHKSILDMFFQKLILFFQPLRTGNIIRVHPGDIFSSGLRDTGVQRRCKPQVPGMAEHPDPVIPVFIIFQIPRCLSVRTIVTDDQLPVLHCLCQNGLDSFLQLLFVVLVIDAHYHCNQYV